MRAPISKGMTAIAAGKAAQLLPHAAPQRQHLEEFTHLVFVEQLLRIGHRGDVGAFQQLQQPAVHQETRLAGVADHVQPGLLPGQCDAGEIDMRGDVLGADIGQRVRVGQMPAVSGVSTK